MSWFVILIVQKQGRLNPKILVREISFGDWYWWNSGQNYDFCIALDYLKFFRGKVLLSRGVEIYKVGWLQFEQVLKRVVGIWKWYQKVLKQMSQRPWILFVFDCFFMRSVYIMVFFNSDCSTFIWCLEFKKKKKKICEFGQNNEKISGTYLGFTCFFFSWTPIV